MCAELELRKFFSKTHYKIIYLIYFNLKWKKKINCENEKIKSWISRQIIKHEKDDIYVDDDEEEDTVCRKKKKKEVSKLFNSLLLFTEMDR